MSRKKVSTTIYITPEQADRLKLLHERTKVPIAVYIREGIDMMLKHYEHVLPGQMTLDAQPPTSGQITLTPRPASREARESVPASAAPPTVSSRGPSRPGEPDQGLSSRRQQYGLILECGAHELRSSKSGVICRERKSRRPSTSRPSRPST